MKVTLVILFAISLGYSGAYEVDYSSQYECFPLVDEEIIGNGSGESEITLEHEVEPETETETEATVNTTTSNSFVEDTEYFDYDNDSGRHLRSISESDIETIDGDYNITFFITSPGYPNPYPDKYYKNCTISLPKATKILIEVTQLDLKRDADYLLIRAGDEINTNFTQHILQGKLPEGTTESFAILEDDNIFMEFVSESDNFESRGFVVKITATYYDELVITPPPEVTDAPPFNLESYEVILELPAANRTNATWEVFKTILAMSASQYVTDEKLELEDASPSNVTIVWVKKCPITWPNNENCIRLDFAISLHEKVPTLDPDYQLNSTNLEKLWLTVGKNLFISNDFPEFLLPDTNRALLMWSLISLGIVLAFLIVLYAIWRQDFFQDYSRMHNQNDDKVKILKNKEIDISQFPTTHQIVPTFFPNEQYGMRSETGLPYDYDSKPISFTRNDFPLNDPNVQPDHLDHFLQYSTAPPDFNAPVNNFNEPAQRPSQAFYPDDFNSLPSTPSSIRARDKIIFRDNNKEESMS